MKTVESMMKIEKPHIYNKIYNQPKNKKLKSPDKG